MNIRYTDISVPNFSELYRKILIILLFYLYLFQPPVINKNYYIITEAIIFVLYIILTKRNFIGSFLRKFKIELTFLFFILIYSIERDLFKGEEVYSERFAAWIFQAFIFGYFIIDIIENRNDRYKNRNDIITLVYWASFIAAVLTFILLMNKPIDTYYMSIQVDDFDRYSQMEQRYRAYGVSENLTFTYSYVLGFFCGYSLLVIKRNILLILPMLLFMLGVFFNARIGFMPILCFALILIFKRDWLNISITTGVGFVIISVLIYSSLGELVMVNKDWAFQFFYDISDTLFGTNYTSEFGGSTINTLTNTFLIFPEGFFEWIFGSGESLYEKPLGENSDVGYILQLNYGGLIFLFLIIGMMIYMCKRLYKTFGWKNWFFIIFSISIFALNFKGFIFAATPGGRLLFFLYTYFIYQSYRVENTKRHIT